MGLLLLKAGMYDNVIRVLVPLNITDEQLQKGLDIVEAAFSEVTTSEPAPIS
jgi:4-aminobutyrate aminotransferase / (S)-3-amino-2-methylpropionate transaminase / 5-aminovalerate transaminase